MSTLSAMLGGLLWPLPAALLPFEPSTTTAARPEQAQHRRLVAQCEALRGPIDDAVALTADLLHHGGRLFVLGHGARLQVAALLADEINRRAARWAPSRRSRAKAITGDDGAGGFVQARGRPGDVAWWLAENGDAGPLLRAVSAARSGGMGNVVIVGRGAGAVRALADICLALPNPHPQQVRQAQLFLGHALVRQIDAALRAVPVVAVAAA